MDMEIYIHIITKLVGHDIVELVITLPIIILFWVYKRPGLSSQNKNYRNESSETKVLLIN